MANKNLNKPMKISIGLMKQIKIKNQFYIKA